MSQVFIKGIPESLKIEREEAVQIAKILENAEIDKDQTISISGWTGQKKDVRYVVIEKERSYSKDQEYTNEEMRLFEKNDLAKYLENGKLSFKNQMRFYADQGVMNVRALIDDPKTSTHFNLSVVDPSRYALLRNKVSAWIDYRGKIAYAKMKESERLELLAKQQQYAE